MNGPQGLLSKAPTPGARLTAEGVEFCVYAGHAKAVWLCLFDAENRETRVACEDVGAGYWAVFVPEAGVGTRYAYRADGPWAPREGMRYNVNKLLIDPYGLAIEGDVRWVPDVFGHRVDADFQGDADIMDTRDSAPFMPRNVVVSTDFDWADDACPALAARDAVIYEMHVKGFTQDLPGVPGDLRGTYAGLAHPAAIAHLTSLGVTSVELLPVHSFTHEPHLIKLGLTNYWGYNTLGFLAPHAAYAAADDPSAVLAEFKTMVKALHAAGLEVILDVVYNHTAEQGCHEGATLSLRGLDSRIAYRLNEAGMDVDVTGCGNTVDLRHPATLRMVMDSLRYWVSEMHVDGFRFDLGVALGRGPDDDFNANSAFLMALRTDPVLSQVKLIAEPWDIGMHGWQTGQFPPPFSEWNDRFRNTVRDFWLTDVARDSRGEPGHGIADLATRIAGSSDVFASPFRRPEASINFVTAHDGWPLADLVTYEIKRNEANGEDNRDGSNDNRSWNHGVEGPSDDEVVIESRYRTMRNMLATLLLSCGVPMLTAGDEFARTQQGNNNAYCQDSPISWINWRLDREQRHLQDTVEFLLRLRAATPVLRRTSFFNGSGTLGEEVDLYWFGQGGRVVSGGEWHDPYVRVMQAFFDGRADGEGNLLLILNGSHHEREVTLPDVPGVSRWDVLWDSAVANLKEQVGDQLAPRAIRRLEANSMIIARAE